MASGRSVVNAAPPDFWFPWRAARMSNGFEAWFECDSCGKRYRWDPSLAGQKIPCSGCGHIMRVPKTEPVAQEKEGEGTIPVEPTEEERGARPSAAAERRARRERQARRRAERTQAGAERYARRENRPAGRERSADREEEEGEDEHSELDAIELADEKEEAGREASVECPSCGTQIPGGQRVCPACGLNLYTGEKVGRKRRRGEREPRRPENGDGAGEAEPRPRRRREREERGKTRAERSARSERRPRAGADEPEMPRVYRKREWQVPLYITAAGVPLLLVVKFLHLLAGDFGVGGFAAEFGWLVLGAVLGVLILTGAGLLSGFLLDHDFGPLDTVFMKFTAAYLAGAVFAGLITLPFGGEVAAGWVQISAAALSLAVGVPVFLAMAMGLMMWFFDASIIHAALAGFISLLFGAIVQAVIPATALFAFLVETG